VFTDVTTVRSTIDNRLKRDIKASKLLLVGEDTASNEEKRRQVVIASAASDEKEEPQLVILPSSLAGSLGLPLLKTQFGCWLKQA
jgi:hypothetical protein